MKRIDRSYTDPECKFNLGIKMYGSKKVGIGNIIFDIGEGNRLSGGSLSILKQAKMFLHEERVSQLIHKMKEALPKNVPGSWK